MNHGSLFSGIGGFDLPAEWMGWENVFHCEYNPFCQHILKYYWPNATTYTDIRETDFTVWRGRLDILTGGFPCQPYSTAGKRKGKEDDRHLWPEMLRAVRESRPRWIVGENVRGLVSWNAGLVFEEVQADLEAEGYEVQPFVLPAAGVGAPHKRERVWFVAFNAEFQPNGADNNRASSGIGMEVERDELHKAGWEQSANFANSSIADAPCSANSGVESVRRLGQNQVHGFKLTPDPDHPGSNSPGHKVNGNGPAQGKERQREPQCRDSGPSGGRVVADAPEQGLPGGFSPGRRSPGAEEATQPGRLPEGAYTAPDWAAFPTQPPVLPGNDGLSAPVAGYTARQWYNEHIKAAGNAIVPKVALQIFRAIEAYERETSM